MLKVHPEGFWRLARSPAAATGHQKNCWQNAEINPSGNYCGLKLAAIMGADSISGRNGGELPGSEQAVGAV